MDLKKAILIMSMIILFTSIIAVSSAYSHQNDHDMESILEDYNESNLTGCCSVVLQLEGNNSMISFRRDANLTADIYIEQIDWYGKPAIKQYKTTGGYFCQVIITSDGWIIGYGGIDDGDDSEKIENITAEMVTGNGTISESVLEEIQNIKAPYKIGHVIIKAPNGTYGIATATTHFTGKLEPGEYVSIPNRVSFFRSGNVTLNSTNKVGIMDTLAISDGFGLSRRDVTIFDFNSTEAANITNIYASNDDGSYWGRSEGGLCDNIHFNGTVIKAEDIPIAPNYTYVGNVTFENEYNNVNTTSANIIIFVVAAVVIALISYGSYQIVKKARKKYKR